MKNIKIITLAILLLGYISSFSQQTATVNHIDETGAKIEQTDQAVMPADDSPAIQQGELPSTITTQQQALEPGNTVMVQPGERDETMPPEGPQHPDPLTLTNDLENQAVQKRDYEGPDEATGPIQVKPD